MNPYVILLWGKDALLARETLVIYIYIYISFLKSKKVKSLTKIRHDVSILP